MLKYLSKLFSKKNAQFDYKYAKKYELKVSREWIKNNFERLYIDITNKDKQKEIIFEDFFTNSNDWKIFVNFIQDKSCMEIGSGPAGAIIRWWWTKRRIIIDPLILDYKNISIELYRKTWFDETIETLAMEGEIFVDSLEKKIDGAIVCRNALDHCSNPLKIINNISRYAVSNCYLLLWTDLHHTDGHDEGHHNITEDVFYFEGLIKSLGFEIISKCKDLRNGKKVNYGCVARKI